MTKAENADKTQTDIIQTLFTLMKTSDYAAIKFSEIAKLSGYGRATVYRYFRTKEDIIRCYFHKHIRLFEDIRTMQIGTRDDYYEIVFRVFSTLKSAKATISLLMQAHLEFLYLEFLNETMAENFRLNRYSDFKYSPYYFAGSLFNVSMEWLRNDCDESVRQLSELYVEHLFTAFPRRPHGDRPLPGRELLADFPKIKE